MSEVKLRCIAVMPYWAELIHEGIKRNEVRSYNISSGWLGIVATKKTHSNYSSRYTPGLLAVVYVSGTRLFQAQDEVTSYYPYQPGLFLWEFSEILPVHVAVKARQGVFYANMPRSSLPAILT